MLIVSEKTKCNLCGNDNLDCLTEVESVNDFGYICNNCSLETRKSTGSNILNSHEDKEVIMYHGTDKVGFNFTLNQGFLLYPRGTSSPCVYLGKTSDIAKIYGNIILEVHFNPHLFTSNYTNEGWQVRCYDPIPLSRVFILK